MTLSQLPSGDRYVPVGMVISLTAINAFVDGVSVISFCLVSRIFEISTIAPELRWYRVIAPSSITMLAPDPSVYVPSGIGTGEGFATLASMSRPDLMLYDATTFLVAGSVVSGDAAAGSCAAAVAAENAIAIATVRSTGNKRGLTIGVCTKFLSGPSPRNDEDFGSWDSHED